MSLNLNQKIIDESLKAHYCSSSHVATPCPLNQWEVFVLENIQSCGLGLIINDVNDTKVDES